MTNLHRAASPSHSVPRLRERQAPVPGGFVPYQTIGILAPKKRKPTFSDDLNPCGRKTGRDEPLPAKKPGAPQSVVRTSSLLLRDGSRDDRTAHWPCNKYRVVTAWTSGLPGSFDTLEPETG